MSYEDLKERTRNFALCVIRLTEALPVSRTADVVGKQLLRCGTSVGANYRAACRAKSRRDFIAKLKIVEEECDESVYWMDLLVAAGLIRDAQISSLIEEATELIAIVVSSIKTARSRS